MVRTEGTRHDGHQELGTRQDFLDDGKETTGIKGKYQQYNYQENDTHL